MKITLCDRCGKKISNCEVINKNEEHKYKLMLVDLAKCGDERRPEPALDLCKDCRLSLWDWLNTEEKRRDYNGQ